MRRAQGFAACLGLVSLLAMGVGPAAAQGPMGFGPRGEMDGLGDGLRLPLLLRGAHLTPDQQAKVRDVLTAHRGAIRSLTEQLRQAQDEVADRLFVPGPVQPADLQSSLQRITQLREQLLQESAKVAVEVRALLTADQVTQAARVKDRLRALTTEMRQLMGEGRP
jgi:Spy/CpxP family protein refolding chaperone